MKIIILKDDRGFILVDDLIIHKDTNKNGVPKPNPHVTLILGKCTCYKNTCDCVNELHVPRKLISDIETVSDVSPYECKHPVDKIVRSGLSAKCKECGTTLGWWCPDNPTHQCEYDEWEECIHCGHPEERK